MLVTVCNYKTSKLLGIWIFELKKKKKKKKKKGVSFISSLGFTYKYSTTSYDWFDDMLSYLMLKLASFYFSFF